MPQFSAEMVYEENFLNGFIVLLMLKIDAFLIVICVRKAGGSPRLKPEIQLNSGGIWILSKVYQRRESGKLRMLRKLGILHQCSVF